MIFYFLIFVLGLIVGSFLNVVVLRLNTGQPIFFGRSRCFSCGHHLGFFDLIPILSFLIQKGRCRYCQSKISRQYPLVEAITGAVFVLVFLVVSSRYVSSQTGWLLATGYWLLIFSFLIAISVYDLRHQIIPDKLVYPFIALSALPVVLGFGDWNLFENWKLEIENSGLLSHLLSGAAFFGLFTLLWLISRGRWMGFGDAKLALGIGFLLGPLNALAAFLFSFWLGGLVGTLLLLLRGRKFTMKTQIPFGPFLALGAFLAFLVGEKFIYLFF